MAGITESRPGEGRFDTLIRLLGLKAPQTRQEAAAMFCQAGKPITPFLILEAIKPGKRSQHRIAILDVVRQIGGPLGPEDMFRLQDLLRHRDSAVCQKAEEVIISMAPGGVPKTPEGLARMRMFNPFLALPSRRRRT